MVSVFFNFIMYYIYVTIKVKDLEINYYFSLKVFLDLTFNLEIVIDGDYVF